MEITITDIPTPTRGAQGRSALSAALASQADRYGDAVVASGSASETDRPTAEDIEWAASLVAKLLLSAEGGRIPAALMVNLVADSSPM